MGQNSSMDSGKLAMCVGSDSIHCADCFSDKTDACAKITNPDEEFSDGRKQVVMRLNSFRKSELLIFLEFI